MMTFTPTAMEAELLTCRECGDNILKCGCDICPQFNFVWQCITPTRRPDAFRWQPTPPRVDEADPADCTCADQPQWCDACVARIEAQNGLIKRTTFTPPIPIKAPAEPPTQGSLGIARAAANLNRSHGSFMQGAARWLP